MTRDVLEELARGGSDQIRDGYARYGIVAPRAFGWDVGGLRRLAKRLGRSHALALELWESGWYEARLLAAFVDDPADVTPEQMDRWCADFDNWGICDTVCFALFDRTSHAWAKVGEWSRLQGEFPRRGAFALLASLALHRKDAPDDYFLGTLPLIEEAATDERNFVKKGVSWALVAIGSRSRVLHEQALRLAESLSERGGAGRWIGKDAIRKLQSAATVKRLQREVKHPRHD